MKLVALGLVAVVLTLAVLLGLALVRTSAPDDAGQEFAGGEVVPLPPFRSGAFEDPDDVGQEFAGWEATIVGGEVRIPED